MDELVVEVRMRYWCECKVRDRGNRRRRTSALLSFRSLLMYLYISFSILRENRKRTSLVGTDDADTSKCFDRGKLLDDGFTFRHPQNTESEGNGGDNR